MRSIGLLVDEKFFDRFGIDRVKMEEHFPVYRYHVGDGKYTIVIKQDLEKLEDGIEFLKSHSKRIFDFGFIETEGVFGIFGYSGNGFVVPSFVKEENVLEFENAEGEEYLANSDIPVVAIRLGFGKLKSGSKKYEALMKDAFALCYDFLRVYDN